MTKSKKHGPGGRPRAQIDWALVARMCGFFASATEIARVIGCHVDTLSNRCEAEHGVSFSVFRRQKELAGRAKLRVLQFEEAMKGSAPMLIFLGKNVLGQADHVASILTTDPLAELVSEFKRRNEILSRTASDEDPVPGEIPPSLIN